MALTWLYPLAGLSIRAAPAGVGRSRAALLRRADRALEVARRHHCGCLLLRLQLSGIDTLLATHGEVFVEAALRVVAERLRRQIRAEDLVARTGNDEFALLAQGIDGPLHAAGEAIARRVTESLTRSYGMDGVRFELGMRIGIAGFPDDANNAAGLVLGASQALHTARRSERDGWRFAAPIAVAQLARV